MAVSTIKAPSYEEVELTKVTTNYGIDVYYKKIAGIRLLLVQGNPAGQVGTGGHTISLANTIVESDAFFRVVATPIGASNYYSIQLQNNSLKIVPLSATSAYVNALFVY